MYRGCAVLFFILHKVQISVANDTEEEECKDEELPEGESCPPIENDKGGLSAGAIAGIVLACIAAVAIITGVALFYFKLLCFKPPKTPPKRRKSTLPIIIFGNSNIGFTKPPDADDKDPDERIPIPYHAKPHETENEDQDQTTRKQSTISLSLHKRGSLTFPKSPEPVLYSGSGYLVPLSLNTNVHDQESRSEPSTTYFKVIDEFSTTTKDDNRSNEKMHEDDTPPPLPVTPVPVISYATRKSSLRRQSDDSTYWDLYSVIEDGENVYADVHY